MFDKISVKHRFIIAGVFLLPVIVWFYFAVAPRTDERLMERRWCVSEMISDGKSFYPHTVHDGVVQLVWEGCEEQIVFDAAVELPGFNSPKIFAQWYMDDDSLVISWTGEHAEIYNGKYEVEFYGQELVLTSARTKIRLRQHRLPMENLM